MTDQKIVMLLSGFSPSLMKFIVSGEMEEECITLDVDDKIVKSRTQVDPHETLRRVLYDAGLDDARVRSLMPGAHCNVEKPQIDSQSTPPSITTPQRNIWYRVGSLSHFLFYPLSLQDEEDDEDWDDY